MLAIVQITPWHWVGFISCVLVFLAFDLGVFHRKAHVVKFREALMWSGVWFCLALVFALALDPLRGHKEALQFLTGYLIELSLSLDNVFVIALIFAFFRVPAESQHRVLYWGILGALVMRGLMIGLGVALINWLDWVLYLFGLFLLYTGVKMLFIKTEVHPEKNPVVKWACRLFPVTSQFEGQKFLTLAAGRKALTPLALVLLMVETSDLIFALDSIPAIFAVTTKPFIVFTSNVFAILGLRSLYFVLAEAIGSFRYLKIGLSLVLVFIGLKMLIDPHDKVPKWFQYDISTFASLLVVAAIITIAIVLSLLAKRRDKNNDRGNDHHDDKT